MANKKKQEERPVQESVLTCLGGPRSGLYRVYGSLYMFDYQGRLKPGPTVDTYLRLSDLDSVFPTGYGGELKVSRFVFPSGAER